MQNYVFFVQIKYFQGSFVSGILYMLQKKIIKILQFLQE